METPGPYGGDGGRDGAPTAEVEGIWADGEDGDADETGLGNAMANMIQQQSPPPGAGRPNHPQGKTPATVCRRSAGTRVATMFKDQGRQTPHPKKS